jgi:putative redox protein
MDLVEIIRKQRMDLKDLSVAIHGDRPDSVPAPFTKIVMHFTLTGQLDAAKVERALELAVRKYCSVEAMLIKAAEIDYTWEIIPA